MFNLGMTEMIFIAILALILIGPKQLPEVARTLGRFLNDLRRASTGLMTDIKDGVKADVDLDKTVKDLKKKLANPMNLNPMHTGVKPEQTIHTTSSIDNSLKTPPVQKIEPEQMTFNIPDTLSPEQIKAMLDERASKKDG